MAKAFSNIRVVDFTQVLAGPFATQQLAMLGADVIKVEQPKTGDETRALAADPSGDGMTPSFMSCNTGKRSITMDLKHPEAKEALRRLVKTADVLVENFRPGVMGRLGLDYETCAGLKPDLVYCSISGYGQSGPKSGVAAYDGAIQADSGMMSITGTEASGPLRTGYMPVDMSTAINAAFAISAALLRRNVTGAGQRLDVAMLDTSIVMQTAQFAKFLGTGELPKRLGNKSPTGLPTANVFETADGHLQILALRETQVAKLFAVLGAQEILASDNFRTREARIEHYDEVSAFVGSRLQQHSTDHWYGALLEAGVPVSLVRDFSEVRADPQLVGRNVFADIPSPIDGTIQTVIGSAYVADEDGPGTPQAPPRLGEHTDEILEELGLMETAIQDLHDNGAV
ncbi:MAG: CoA transferase [Chromatiales bacterium]|nr:CoA transferase [Chromatiales bacterium]